MQNRHNLHAQATGLTCNQGPRSKLQRSPGKKHSGDERSDSGHDAEQCRLFNVGALAAAIGPGDEGKVLIFLHEGIVWNRPVWHQPRQDGVSALLYRESWPIGGHLLHKN
jgi:hypothetical protein